MLPKIRAGAARPRLRNACVLAIIARADMSSLAVIATAGAEGWLARAGASPGVANAAIFRAAALTVRFLTCRLTAQCTLALPV